jgi:dienelactone hydrolase
VDGVPLYVVGDEGCSKGVILCYDIFGLEGSRIRNIADQLAGEGFVVLIPDVFDGSGIGLTGFAQGTPEV